MSKLPVALIIIVLVGAFGLSAWAIHNGYSGTAVFMVGAAVWLVAEYLNRDRDKR